MMRVEVTAALEELLLLQRAFADHTFNSTTADVSLENVLMSFQATLSNQNSQDLSVWQLKIIEIIRSILNTHVGSYIGAAVDDAISGELQDPTHVLSSVKDQVEKSHELQEAITLIKHIIKDAVDTLKEIYKFDRMNTVESEHSLAKFWKKLQERVEMKKHKKTSENQQGDSVYPDWDSGSFEGLSLDDDFNDTSRSARSFSSMDDIPTTIRKMQSTDAVERVTGLDEFMQVPILEIVHSGPLFSTACSAVVGLLLKTERAHRFMYDLMNYLEDAAQFLELFWAVLDFIGTHLETGELFLNREDICQSTDVRKIAVLDCFRIFHTLLCKVMRHWIYFSPEALAQLLHSTFSLLTIYSKEEAEVDSIQMNALSMLFLIVDDPVRWLELWQLNVPNIQQLFVAMDESGFILYLLQYLSRLQPLNLIPSIHSSAKNIDKRSAQCILAVVSYICEYQQGRDLLSQWRRLPARVYTKRRLKSWERSALKPVAIDNGMIYHCKVQVPVPASESTNMQELLDGKEAECKILKENVVDAIILSIATIFATDADILYNDRWAKNISKSVAAYLHYACCNDSLAALAKMIDACWVDYSSKSKADAEDKEISEWEPFRQPKSAIEISQLVTEYLSKRHRQENVPLNLQAAGQLLLQMILSSKAVIYAVTLDHKLDATELVFKLCKQYLQLRYRELTILRQKSNLWTGGSSTLFDLIVDTALDPRTFNVARAAGVIKELWNICLRLSERKDDLEFLHFSGRIIRAVCYSARALNEYDTAIVNAFLHTQSHELAALSFRDLLGCLSNQGFAQTFFRLADIQGTLHQIITDLQTTVDFTIALNSSNEECPLHLITPIRRLQWVRSCLSSQFAYLSLFSMITSPLVVFTGRMLAIHRAGYCTSSCHAEDTCCVVFQLLLSLVSSVPSMLECSSLLSQLHVIKFDDVCTLHRSMLYDNNDIVSSCSFLEKQLCYEFQFIGGPKEKRYQRELFAFNEHLRASKDFHEISPAEMPELTHFECAFMLQDKILQIIQTSFLVPLDFAEISRASWELINYHESQLDTESSFGISKSANTFTKIYARLMFSFVMSKCSPLELAVRTVGDEEVKHTAGSSQNVEHFLPATSQWKCMSNLYQNYANGLALESSPTLMDCIVKTFGKTSMDCFPVTFLMILYPTYQEADILKFLLHCLASPSANFLWPRSATYCAEENCYTTTAIVIAENVEIILHCEFPQIIHAINQCQCSVLALVLRWCGQHFWNYLDWENIVIYTYLIILYGVDFQVYIIVAILKHLEPTMRELMARHSPQSPALFLTLIREPIRDFRFSTYQNFLIRLRNDYHEELDTFLFSPGKTSSANCSTPGGP